MIGVFGMFGLSVTRNSKVTFSPQGQNMHSRIPFEHIHQLTEFYLLVLSVIFWIILQS